MAQLVEQAGELLDIFKASGAKDRHCVEPDYQNSEQTVIPKPGVRNQSAPHKSRSPDN
jgi:hypothetical protein